MKKTLTRLSSVAALGLLVGLTGCTGDTNTTPTATDEVAGTLRDAATGEPVVGALIKSGWGTARTDASGNWNLGHPAIAPNITNGAPAGYTVSVDTTQVTFPINIATQKVGAKEATNYPTLVYRTINNATAGATNPLVVGKQTLAIKGKVVTSTDALYTAGGKVELIYTEGQANNQNFGPTTVTAGTGNGFVYKKADIGTDGTFSFSNAEYGAAYTVVAANADGTLFGTAAASTGAAVSDLIANVKVTLGSTDQQVLQIASVTAKVGTADATVTGVNSGAAVLAGTLATATSELAPGATAVTFTFTKAFTAAQKAYLATNATNGTFYNDVQVTYTSKAGNIAHSIATTDNTITVSFDTATSGIYAVDLNAAAGKLGLVDALPAVNGVDANPGVQAARGRVVFTTTGGTAVTAVGPIRLYNIAAGAAAGSFTIDWAPVAGAKGYNVYRQMVQTFVDGTTKAHDFTLVSAAAAPNYQTATQYTTPALAFAEVDSVRLSYVYKVRSVNSDGLESVDQAATSMLTLTDSSALVAADGSTGVALKPTAVKAVAAVTNLLPTGAAAYVANGGVVGQTPAIVAPALVPVATTFTGNYSQNGTSTTLTSTVTFSEPMIKSLVEDKTKWGIAIPGATTVTPAPTVYGNAFGIASAPGVTLSFTLSNVIYNAVTKVATLTYTVGYSLTSATTDAASTNVSLAAPAYVLTFAGTDLNGNTMNYGTARGF